jgi:chromosome segregation ATPase
MDSDDTASSSGGDNGVLLDSLSERLALGASNARRVRSLQAQLLSLRKEQQETAARTSRQLKQASMSVERAQSQSKQAMRTQKVLKDKLQQYQAQQGQELRELRAKLAGANEQARQLQDEVKVCALQHSTS